MATNDGRAARPLAAEADGNAAGRNGGHGVTALPVRKPLNHRGPLSIDVTSAWYFITICAEGHNPWVIDDGKGGRAARPLAAVAEDMFSTVRHYQKIGKWKVALFLLMPDHVHLIVHIPRDVGGEGSRRPTTLDSVISDFKHAVSRRFGIRFQRDFFDTRLRDDAHFAEKYDYILGNPVRKGLCAEFSEWPYAIAFSRQTGEEDYGGRGATALPRRDKGISNLQLEKVFTEEPCHIRVAL